MNKQEKKMIVPQLRFPEFQDDEEWIETTVGQVAEYENGKAHEQDIVQNGKFIVVNSKFISTDGEVKKFTNTAFCIAKKGDILMVLSDVPKGRAIAKCFFIDIDNLYTVNQRICKITPINVVGIMLFYLLNRNSYFLAFDDGVKQTNLKKDDVLDCTILLPKSLKEQQKIADCLSSIDNLITAENDKLEALKAHKKGLMQQLFPAEGETVPKLRFEEFQDSGEWEVITITELVNRNILYAPTDGNHGELHPKSTDYVETGIPFVMARDIQNGEVNFSTCAYIEKKLADTLRKGFAKENDILITHKGSIGEVAVVKKTVYPYLMLTPQVTYYRVKDKNKLDNRYLAFLFISEYFQKNMKDASDSGTRPYVGIIEQGKFIVMFPKEIEEQRKIIDCLSSLDSLKAAQHDKIAALKAHKKGLMQQLFPNTNDINNE